MSDAKLKSLVERLERLIEERNGISDDIRDVFAEAEGVGYDRAALRRLVSWRALDAGEQDNREYLDDCYRAALEGRDANLPTDGPRDPELAKAVDLFRSGKTVRDVKDALKVSLGKAAKLHARAKPFLDAARKRGRPSAKVHVHPSVNNSAGEIAEQNGAPRGPSAAASPQPAPDGGVGRGTHSHPLTLVGNPWTGFTSVTPGSITGSTADARNLPPHTVTPTNPDAPVLAVPASVAVGDADGSPPAPAAAIPDDDPLDLPSYLDRRHEPRRPA